MLHLLIIPWIGRCSQLLTPGVLLLLLDVREIMAIKLHYQLRAITYPRWSTLHWSFLIDAIWCTGLTLLLAEPYLAITFEVVILGIGCWNWVCLDICVQRHCGQTMWVSSIIIDSRCITTTGSNVNGIRSCHERVLRAVKIVVTVGDWGLVGFGWGKGFL